MGGINNDKAMKSILEGVDYMIKKAIKDAPSDKIYVATVLEAKNNNLYKIQLKDKVYDNIPSLFQDIIQNEPVRVVVPQNNYNQMFILGKHNMDSIGDYNNLKNKPQINGVELKGNKTAKDLGLVSEAMLAEFFKDREYKAGEYTIYQGEMYKAKKNTDVTTTGFKYPFDVGTKYNDKLFIDHKDINDRGLLWKGYSENKAQGFMYWCQFSRGVEYVIMSQDENFTMEQTSQIMQTEQIINVSDKRPPSTLGSYHKYTQISDGRFWYVRPFGISRTRLDYGEDPFMNAMFIDIREQFGDITQDDELGTQMLNRLGRADVIEYVLSIVEGSETKYVPPYDTDYWEKIPNVMSQIVALAKMYNDFDAYSKGDYAMYDGDLYKLIKDNNDSTGIFYPYFVNEGESQNHSQIVSMDNDGKGEYYTGIEGSGAIIWFQCSNRSAPSSPPYIYMLLSQDPNFTVAEIKQSDYNSDWFQNILNDPTSASYDNYIKGVWNKVSTETTRNNYCRQYTLDNGETWYLRLSRVHFGSGEVPQFQQGTREYGIHISVDTSVWFYSGSGASQNNILTRDFLEYVLSVIITKGAKQPPTNSNYWRKVDYLIDEVTDYDNLRNKPKINGHELIGDKSTADLEILPPIASKTQFGGVIIGDGIDVDETGKISIDGDFLPTPTLDGNIMVVEDEEWIQKPLEDAETDPTVPQYVKDITEEDIEKWNQGGEIPIASATQLGGVKIGNGITITEDGTISAQGGGGESLPTPTAKDNILVSTEDSWEQKNISTATIPSFTKAEYELIKDELPIGTRFIISDEEEQGEVELGYGSLEIYSGAWTADNNNALNKILTESITIPKGKYLLIVQYPTIGIATSTYYFWSLIFNNGERLYNATSMYGSSSANNVFVLDLTAEENIIDLRSAQSSSVNFASKENGFIKAIKLDTLFDTSAPSDNYSSTENIPIGKWIDGKTIYQRVIDNVDWTLTTTTGWQSKMLDMVEYLNIDKSISVRLFRDDVGLIEYIPRIVSMSNNNDGNYITLRGQGNSLTDAITIGKVIVQFTQND